MVDTVTLRGKTYSVEPFTMTHMAVVGKAIEPQPDGLYGMAGLTEQTKSAEMVKLVVCPDIPDDCIYQNKSGRYIYLLEPDEIATLSLQFLRICYRKELVKAEKGKDTERIAMLKAQIAHYDEILADSDQILQGGSEPDKKKTPRSFSDLVELEPASEPEKKTPLAISQASIDDMVAADMEPTS